MACSSGYYYMYILNVFYRGMSVENVSLEMQTSSFSGINYHSNRSYLKNVRGFKVGMI